jgi:hypothetical protein
MANPERIREIIEFVSVDAYTEDEVMAGWSVALADAAALPFQATALGTPVTVVEFDSDARHGIRCEIQGEGIGRRCVGIDTLTGSSLCDGVHLDADRHAILGRSLADVVGTLLWGTPAHVEGQEAEAGPARPR